jgi:outer membrane receptor protein involved in Fe transport
MLRMQSRSVPTLSRLFAFHLYLYLIPIVLTIVVHARVHAQSTHAQVTGTGVVTGRVVDGTDGHALEFASVALLRAADSSVVTGSVTDRKGVFVITNVPPGDFLCRVSMMGYTTVYRDAVKVASGRKNVYLDAIALLPSTVPLKGVEVVQETPLMANTIDRRVYNVTEDVLSKSASVSEVLQNVPSVEVDMDGNVSLRGSGNVQILINGKTSPLMDKNSAVALQQLPANALERIEVITNPSAKYKPDGTAGIINLVLKKNTDLGVNGSVSANVGNQGRYNGTARLNYNPGDLNFFGSYSLRQDVRNRISTDDRMMNDSAGVLSFYDEDATVHAKPLSHLGSLGFDAEIDAQNTAGLSGTAYYDRFSRDDHSTKAWRDSNGATTTQYDRDRAGDETETEYEATGFFEHRFGEEHTLRAEGTLSRMKETEEFQSTNTYTLPTAPDEFDNLTNTQREDRAQATLDYARPLAGGGSLETGYAGEFGHSEYVNGAEYYDPAVQGFVNDSTKSNRFLNDQSIHALYGTWQKEFGPLGVMAGLRAEQATVLSDLVTTDSTVTTHQFSLYPTAHVSHSFDEATELRLSYSRRTNRPEADDLNPFPEYRDDKNVYAGNPYLEPEYIESLELGAKADRGDFSFLPTVYYKYTSNKFTSVTTLLPDSTLLTTRENLAHDESAGLEVILSGGLDGLLTANLSANIYYMRIDATNLGYGADKSTVTWRGALTCSAHLTRSTLLQLNANYNAARLTPQGEYKPSGVVNLGARQELLDGALTIVVTVADIFHTLRRELVLDTPELQQTTVNRRDSRVIYAGLTWTFGAKPKKQDSEIKYDNGL